MFQGLLEPITDEFSGKRAWLDVNQLWLYRNTVLTPGLREACRYCVGRFRENGVRKAEMVSYKADGKTRYGDTTLRMEWQPKSATLSVVKPKENACRLTTFEENALSLICRSAATPKGGVEAKVVVVDDGTKEEHYRGLNVRGKIVMTARHPAGVAGLAGKRGAIGVITDTIDRPKVSGTDPTRDPEDGPDAVQWVTFGGTEPPDLFGFVLSPRMGGRLRRLVREARQPVVLRAEVDATSRAGHSDVVDAVVKGRGNEELWVLSHISEPGAYDNASGCAVSMEIARTLEALTASGTLPPMKRSVRFLFSTEVSGFLPYLHEQQKKLPGVLGGLCIDSVGVDVGKVGSDFVIFRAPEFAASFSEHLVAEITDTVTRMSARHFGEDNYGPFPWHLEDYWGNDAFITDPYFDIPTPQLSCWPYRYYHTSMDLPEFISPDNLARAGVICATHLYFLACAGPREAAWMSAMTAAKAKTRIAEELNRAALAQEGTLHGKRTRPKLLSAAKRLKLCSEYYGALEQDAVRQPVRFAPKDRSLRRLVEETASSVAAAAERELGVARGLLQNLTGTPLPQAPDDADPAERQEAERLVPRRKAWHQPAERTVRKPVRTRLEALRNRPEAKGVNFAAIWPWANGERTIHEISQRVQYRQECSLSVVLDYFRIMEGAGCVEMVGDVKGNA